jgi:nucleoside-diphosphate-sugar epimerase
VKIAVTGASGFVGAQVVRALSQEGFEVQAIVRATSDPRRISGLPGVQVVEADVLTVEGRNTIAALRADACVHAAWYAEPGKYLSAPVNADLIHATLSLASSLASHGCRRFVGIGTCFEYDTNVGYLSEASPLGPTHVYSAAKAGTYLVLRQLLAATETQLCWARLFYLYGPDEHPRRLVSGITQALLRGEEARCTPGLQVRDFLHVEDAASAIRALVLSDVVGAVNVASGQPVTVASIVRQLAEHCGRPELVRLGALPYAAGDPMFVCADVRKLLAATGWVPRWSLTDGLGDAVAWWRNAARSRES